MDTKMRFDRESMIARAVVKIEAALEQEKQEHYEQFTQTVHDKEPKSLMFWPLKPQRTICIFCSFVHILCFIKTPIFRVNYQTKYLSLGE